jgi:hypothetical protein
MVIIVALLTSFRFTMVDTARILGTRNKIATAATNGAIIIWDLNKSGRKTGLCECWVTLDFEVLI